MSKENAIRVMKATFPAEEPASNIFSYTVLLENARITLNNAISDFENKHDKSDHLQQLCLYSLRNTAQELTNVTEAIHRYMPGEKA